MKEERSGDAGTAAELDELRRENEQLKREIARLKSLLARKASAEMSSKLRDALRE